MPKEHLDLQIVPTSRFVYTPATPEQIAAYEERMKTTHGGTYYVRHMEAQGRLTKEQADTEVRRLRALRKQRRRRHLLEEDDAG